MLRLSPLEVPVISKSPNFKAARDPLLSQSLFVLNKRGEIHHVYIEQDM